jgi:transcriptional regulator with XRE-family HTH domain
MLEQDLTQSELGRRVGVSQATIFKLLTGESYGTKHLHRIARELQTTPAYLTGETADPELADLPPASPASSQIMLPVTLPSEKALADMFEGLLLAIDRTQPVDEFARELAQLLPTGLAQLQGRLLELPRPPRKRAKRVTKAAALASADHEPQR